MNPFLLATSLAAPAGVGSRVGSVDGTEHVAPTRPKEEAETLAVPSGGATKRDKMPGLHGSTPGVLEVDGGQSMTISDEALYTERDESAPVHSARAA